MRIRRRKEKACENAGMKGEEEKYGGTKRWKRKIRDITGMEEGRKKQT